MDGIDRRSAFLPHEIQQRHHEIQQRQQQQQQTGVGAGGGSIQRTRRGKAWYLDAPENEASPTLLAELGIVDYKVHLEHGSVDVNIQLWKLAQARLAMHSKSGGDAVDRGAIQIGDLPATEFTHDDMEDQGGEARFDCLEGMYCVWGGDAFVDVRDWADCWVRVRLQPGDVVLIPPNRFHRATPTSPGARLVQVRVKTGDGGVNVEIRDPRTAPPPGSSGTIAGDPRELVASLCRQFYDLGWVQGTGGSISIRHGNRVFMTPSGVQKERLVPSDLFVLDRQGLVLSRPWSLPGGPRKKLSACLSLFQHAYRLRNAGAVIHSHGIYCVMATILCERKGLSTFRITHQEMIKGMEGHGFYDELEIPVIPNTAHEEDLADSLAEAIKNYPKSNAVLVSRHGCYVWGPSWEKAKTQAECLHYLLEVAVKMDAVGLDPAEKPRGGCAGCDAGVASPSNRRPGGLKGHGMTTSGVIGSGGLQVQVKEEPRASTSFEGQGGTAGAVTPPCTNSSGAGAGQGMGDIPNSDLHHRRPDPHHHQQQAGFLSSAGVVPSVTGNVELRPQQPCGSTAAPPSSASESFSGPTPGGGSSSGNGGAGGGGGGSREFERNGGAAGGEAKKPRLLLQADETNAPEAEAAAAAGTAPAPSAGTGVSSGGPAVSLEGVKVILLDIEGTTTPITFVKNTLFPYAKEHLAQHLKDNWESEDLQRLVRELKTQAEKDAAVDGIMGVPHVLEASSAGVERAQASVAEYVRFVMSSDRKLGPMKSLQGHVWRQGYTDGGLVGEVYDDVEPAFLRWTQGGKRLAIYSSGSREAQRLLFSKSTVGDLRSYLSAFFDTSVGGKQDSASYTEICLSLGVDSPSEVLFLTDLLGEAEAAKQAGLRVVVSVRPGNEPLADGHPFETVADFNEID